jgi:hypothetical protein
MRVLPYRTSSDQLVVRGSGGRGFRVTRLGGFANRALIVACLLLLNCGIVQAAFHVKVCAVALASAATVAAVVVRVNPFVEAVSDVVALAVVRPSASLLSWEAGRRPGPKLVCALFFLQWYALHPPLLFLNSIATGAVHVFPLVTAVVGIVALLASPSCTLLLRAARRRPRFSTGFPTVMRSKVGPDRSCVRLVTCSRHHPVFRPSFLELIGIL